MVHVQSLGTLSIRVYNVLLVDLFSFLGKFGPQPPPHIPSAVGARVPRQWSSAGGKPVLRPTLTG